MKTFSSYSFILLMFLWSATSEISAQRALPSSSIQLVSQRPDLLHVELNGVLFFNEEVTGSVLFSNLLPGEYRIKAYVVQRGRRGTAYIVDQNLRVPPGQRIVVRVASNNRVTVSTVPDPNSVALCVDGRNEPHYREPVITQHPVSDAEFNRMLAELKRCAFEADRQRMVEAMAAHHFFLSEQLGKVMALFSFDDARLRCAQTLVPRVLDPEHLYLLAGMFSFSKTKNAYLDLIRTR